MSGIQIDLATPEDDASIRALLRQEPMPGQISLSYQREPSFFSSCAVTGDDCSVLVARSENSREIVALATRSTRRVFVNGHPQRLGYLSQLRIASRYRGQWLLSRGFARLKELHQADPLPAYLVSIVAGNPQATGVLVHRRRPSFPIFHPVAEFRTLALRPRHANPKLPVGISIHPATPSQLEEIAQFLSKHGPNRQFFPQTTAESLSKLAQYGLTPQDILVARRAGEIAGILALWDQSAYKQTILHSYSGWLSKLRPLVNLAGPLLALPTLPAPGQMLKSASAAFLCIAQDDPQIFHSLLRSQLTGAHSRGLGSLLLGLDLRDPLLPQALRYRPVVYSSRIYLAEYPAEPQNGVHAQLDGRPIHLEIATL